MNYWIINTDKDCRKDIRACDLWYDYGYAFAGDIEEDLGKHQSFFKRVEPKDMVFMYHSGLGIVGLGEILEEWDRKVYSGKDRLFYRDDLFEYRIPVKWDKKFDSRKSPLIGKEYLPYRSWYAKINSEKWNIEYVINLIRQ